MSSLQNVLVDTTAGTVRGELTASGTAWRGIPYAAPPTGGLRFRAPQPTIPWQGVRDATTYGAIAPQRVVKMLGITEHTPQSEDCLTLNVYRPRSQSTEPLPVMVWIHGGAYALGASSQPAYDGSVMTEAGDVLLVTMNYRLGAFGYLDLSTFSTPERPFDNNLALRDQLQALEWVQANIEAFGGDPRNVTLFGQSAGGGAVTTLMTTPRAHGLFQKAIAQSSPATLVLSTERSSQIAGRLLEHAGVDATPTAVVERLTEMSTSELLGLSDWLYDEVPLATPGVLAYAPIVDGDLVPDFPIRVFERGEQHRIPLVIGNVKDEATLFKFMKSPLVPIEQTKLEAVFTEVRRENPTIDVPSYQKVSAAYRRPASLQARLHIAGDFGFRMPAVWIAQAHSRIAPTYLYRFDFATPAMKIVGLGSTHATEVALEFGRVVSKGSITYKLGGEAGARNVGAQVRDAFTAFARDNSPGHHWDPYESDSQLTYVFDTDSRIVPKLDEALLNAWGHSPLYFH